jgi:hypothetical protein
MHRERKGRDRDIRDRFEVLYWIIKRPRLQNRLGHMRARTAQQQRVAVGARMRDRCGAERAPPAALIFDHDCAEQRLDSVCPWSPNGIEPAAWRKRDDQPDRPLRIVRGGTCLSERQSRR